MRRTLDDDMQRLASMNDRQLYETVQEFWKVPVQIAYGGVNKGLETIQKRFYGWPKGTPRIRIEQWFQRQNVNKRG